MTEGKQAITSWCVQGLFQRGMGPSDVQQGWDLALCSSHVAITLPTRTMAVYQLQVNNSHRPGCFNLSAHYTQVGSECTVSWRYAYSEINLGPVVRDFHGAAAVGKVVVH